MKSLNILGISWNPWPNQGFHEITEMFRDFGFTILPFHWTCVYFNLSNDYTECLKLVTLVVFLLEIIKHWASVVSNMGNISHRAVIRYFDLKGLTPKEMHEDMVVTPMWIPACRRPTLFSYFGSYWLLFSNMKYFARDDDVMNAVDHFSRDQNSVFYTEGIHLIHDRWTKCVNVGGDYVEKWLHLSL